MKVATHQNQTCCTTPWRLRGWVIALLLFISTVPCHSQVINESLAPDTVWHAVGPDSIEYVAQSFLASVKRVRKIGVWMERLAGSGELRLSLMKDNGNNLPDFNFVLHESQILATDTAGGWVWDSTFSAILNSGEKYWIVVDGYQNLIGSGYSAVGVSQAFTSSGDPMRLSDDGGATWGALTNQRLAVHVEGDNCTLPLTVFPANPEMCPGGTVEIWVATGFLSYNWSSGHTSASIYANTLGIYTVQAVDSANCVATASVFVVTGTVPFTQLQESYFICEGSPLFVDVPPFYDTYQWSTGQVGIRDTLTEAGTYWVSITSVSGCVLVDSFEVQVQPYAQVSIGGDSSLCQGDTVILQAPMGYASYLWSDGTLGSVDTLLSTIDAWVQVVDSGGCITRSDTVVYSFHPNPAIPIIEDLPEGLHSSFANGYQWYLDGQPLVGATSQDLPGPVPGVYSVMVTNAFGCMAMSNPYILSPVEPGDFVSEGISPNGDAKNEVFFVEGNWRYPELRLEVYNRWGEKVYAAQPYANDWSGTGPSGSALPDGDYYYILEFGAGRDTLRGTLLISR